MKTKLVFWGANEKEERVLIGMQLRADDNAVDIYVFPETLATEEFTKSMLGDWRNGKTVEFPEGHQHIARELTIAESILPDNLKVERSDIVQRAQTEWHFVVLSTKLNDAYQTELTDLKEKIEQLSSYDSATWNSLKTFWSKVQSQVRERNLFRDHANSLRDSTNELFGKMKGMRASLDEEFNAASKVHYDAFMQNLQDIEKRVVDGMNLNGIFEDLKKIQKSFKETKFSREHRNKVWEKLDGAFKTVKDKRFGPSSGNESSPVDRLNRRYDGLMNAVQKMEKSIHRDKDELAFQKRKVATTDGQLEMQIRQAKIKMIEERVRSKEEKLEDMMQTKIDLQKRKDSLAAKVARQAKKDKVEEAKKEAANKIAKEIKEAEKSRAGKEGDIQKAAEKIGILKKDKKVEKPGNDSVSEALTATLGESIEDVIDTVKAVAEVVGDKIEAAIEEFKPKVDNDISSEEE